MVPLGEDANSVGLKAEIPVVMWQVCLPMGKQKSCGLRSIDSPETGKANNPQDLETITGKARDPLVSGKATQQACTVSAVGDRFAYCSVKQYRKDRGSGVSMPVRSASMTAV